MGRTIGKSAIEVMRKRFPKKASEIETYADAFDVLAEEVKTGGGGSPSGGGGVFEADFVFGEDISEHTTLTLNKTASDLYSALCDGKIVKMTAQEEGIVFVVPVTATEEGAAGEEKYSFFFSIAGEEYSVDRAYPSDTVVFVGTN